MNQPKLEDFPQFYRRYIEKVIDQDIILYFEKQKISTVDFFNSIGEEKSNYRYADGKWSIKQILGHICDAERIFVTRMLQFARKESQSLPGFNEDEYVAAANFDDLELELLIDDFSKLREANLSLFRTFDDNIWGQRGIANNTEYTVSSIVYIMAGHIDHHIKVIKERYLAD